VRVEDADQVDRGIGTGQVVAQGIVVVDVGAADADARQHRHFAVLLAVAAQQQNTVAIGRQPRYEVATDEAGTAEDDKLLCGHTDQSWGES
jgi:hypothetical protein